MTSKDRHIERRTRLLEQILNRVQAIDHNVEEILERISDHFDSSRLDMGFHYNGYNGDSDQDKPYR